MPEEKTPKKPAENADKQKKNKSLGFTIGTTTISAAQRPGEYPKQKTLTDFSLKKRF